MSAMCFTSPTVRENRMTNAHRNVRRKRTRSLGVECLEDGQY